MNQNGDACFARREFNHLRRELGYTFQQLVALTGKSVGVLSHYGAETASGRTPPEDVLETMRKEAKRLSLVRLQEAVDVLRSKGLDIDWASIEPANRDFGGGWKRPRVLGGAA